MKRKHAHAHKKTDKTQLLSKKHSPCFDYDFNCYDVSNEWLPYETANSNESELSAEEQLLKECADEHKNQINLGTVDCTPKPADTETDCEETRQFKLDFTYDADTFYELDKKDRGLVLLKAARDVLRQIETTDFDISRKYTVDLGCPNTIGSLVCDIDWLFSDLTESGIYSESQSVNTSDTPSQKAVADMQTKIRHLESEIQRIDHDREYWQKLANEETAKLEVAEAECARLKKRADLAECKTWDSSDAVAELHAQLEKLQAELDSVRRKNELLNQLVTSGSKTDLTDEAYKPKPALHCWVMFTKNNLQSRQYFKNLRLCALTIRQKYLEYATDTILKDICGQLHVNDVAMFENYYIVRC